MATRTIISPQVMTRHLGDEAVILDLKSGVYFGLEAVGARIWQLIEEKRSSEEMRATLLDEFEVPAETLDRDLKDLLQTLLDRGLISQSDE